MTIDNFELTIKDNILIVTSKKNVTLDDLKEMCAIMENSTHNKYGYGIYRDILGYYDGFDFKRNISVYCGTLNEKIALEKITNYDSEKIKNSSS